MPGAKILETIISAALTIIGKLFTNKQDADAARLKLLELQAQGAFKEMELEWANRNAQLEVNKAEASNSSLFVSGWRPAAGWTCVVALSYTYLLGPLFHDLMAALGTPIAITKLETGDLMMLLMGLLGMAGFRSYDKLKGTTPK